MLQVSSFTHLLWQNKPELCMWVKLPCDPTYCAIEGPLMTVLNG